MSINRIAFPIDNEEAVYCLQSILTEYREKEKATIPAYNCEILEWLINKLENET